MNEPGSETRVDLPGLVAVGEALVDLVPLQPGASIQAAATFAKVAGGAPANVAAGVVRLGGRAKLLGRVGSDSLGSFVLAELAASGVDTGSLRRDPAAQTALALVSLDPLSQQTFEFYGEPAAHWAHSPDDVSHHDLEGAGVLHFGSLSLAREPSRSATLKAIDMAEARGMTITCDPNLRLSLWPAQSRAREVILTAARRAHLIKLSRAELEWLMGASGPAALAGPGTRLLAITDGAAGAHLWARVEHGNFEADVASYRVATVDTTGAGDAFMAALIHSCLTDDRLLTDTSPSGRQRLLAAVKRANAFAALTTTRRGGVPAMPPRGELEEFLSQHPNGV